MMGPCMSCEQRARAVLPYEACIDLIEFGMYEVMSWATVSSSECSNNMPLTIKVDLYQEQLVVCYLLLRTWTLHWAAILSPKRRWM